MFHNFLEKKTGKNEQKRNGHNTFALGWVRASKQSAKIIYYNGLIVYLVLSLLNQ